MGSTEKRNDIHTSLHTFITVSRITAQFYPMFCAEGMKGVANLFLWTKIY